MDNKPGIRESWRDVAVYFVWIVLLSLIAIAVLWAADELTGFTKWLVEII